MTILPNRCSKKTFPTVVRTIRTHGLIPAGEAVLMGVSGGPDSVALFHILHHLASQYKWRLGVAHIDHGLRGVESKRDSRFVADLAAEFEVALHLLETDVEDHRRRRKLSLEEAGREVRYAYYNRIARRHGYQRIATGHHADDNAEVILMSLLRGSGSAGLTGIPYLRFDHYNGPAVDREGEVSGNARAYHPVVRPLLDLTKAEILRFLDENQLPYQTDSTNTNTRFLRNKIRHQLIPLLQNEYNPEISRSLNRLATIQTAEQQWMRSQVESFYVAAVVKRSREQIVLALPKLQIHPRPAQLLILREAVRLLQGDLRRIGYRHLEAAVNLVSLRPGNQAGDKAGYKRVHLPDGLTAVREGETLQLALIRGEEEAAPDGYEYIMQRPGCRIISEAGIGLSVTEHPAEATPQWHRYSGNTAMVDGDRAVFPLTIRAKRPGDRFKPLGAGGTQKLKTFFINIKLPRAERRICPLVVSGGEIVWVAGHRLDDRFKVHAKTRRILKMELFLA